MKKLTRLLVITSIFLIVPAFIAIADEPPPPGGGPGSGDPPVGGGTPIGGGLVVLLAMAGGYAIKKSLNISKRLKK